MFRIRSYRTFDEQEDWEININKVLAFLIQFVNLVYIKHTYVYTNTHLLWLNLNTYNETHKQESQGLFSVCIILTLKLCHNSRKNFL